MAHAFIVRHTEPKTLTGISIVSLPTKTTYTAGDMLDLSGMVVTATYSSGETATITNYTTYPENGSTLSTIGDVTVKISYTENGVTEITSFAVSVAEAKPYAKELEYIESTGTQYIDTGFKPNQNTRVVLDFEAVEKMVAWMAVFGTANSASNADSFAVWRNASNAFRYSFASTNVSIPYSDVGRYFVDCNKNSFTINGTTAVATLSSFQCNKNMILFAQNRTGTVEYFAKYRMYSCKIYDNGSLIRDFIPVLDYDGIACLYDKATKKLYYNQGTGSFKFVQ